MTTQVLTCPFCSKRPSRLVTPIASKYHVFCERCGAEGPAAQTTEEAVRAWNHRVRAKCRS